MGAYLDPPDWRSRSELARDYFNLYHEHEALIKAVRDLYFAAYWAPDRPCDDYGLWTAVRDAAGIAPNTTYDVLGAKRGI